MASRIQVGRLANLAYLVIKFKISLVINVILGLIFYYHCYLKKKKKKKKLIEAWTKFGSQSHVCNRDEHEKAHFTQGLSPKVTMVHHISLCFLLHPAAHKRNMATCTAQLGL
jgi:uncharacterized membrane protein YqiK